MASLAGVTDITLDGVSLPFTDPVEYDPGGFTEEPVMSPVGGLRGSFASDARPAMIKFGCFQVDNATQTTILAAKGASQLVVNKRDGRTITLYNATLKMDPNRNLIEGRFELEFFGEKVED